MTSTIPQSNVAKFAYHVRVRLIDKEHPEAGQSGVIVRVLENPSDCPEHQWYDVRFDDGTYGRLLEKKLERIAS